MTDATSRRLASASPPRLISRGVDSVFPRRALGAFNNTGGGDSLMMLDVGRRGMLDRRDFLALSLGSAAATTAALHASSSRRSSSTPCIHALVFSNRYSHADATMFCARWLKALSRE